ncbi:hypothetical protein T492DRAFT_847557 [Pavlovales sp. CCMP2436]|nr:hypothetical protein T492DRAFT_847557 [Pavlovales sp. CCMP2436]
MAAGVDGKRANEVAEDALAVLCTLPGTDGSSGVGADSGDACEWAAQLRALGGAVGWSAARTLRGALGNAAGWAAAGGPGSVERGLLCARAAAAGGVFGWEEVIRAASAAAADRGVAEGGAGACKVGGAAGGWLFAELATDAAAEGVLILIIKKGAGSRSAEEALDSAMRAAADTGAADTGAADTGDTGSTAATATGRAGTGLAVEALCESARELTARALAGSPAARGGARALVALLGAAMRTVSSGGKCGGEGAAVRLLANLCVWSSHLYLRLSNDYKSVI